MRAVKGLMAAAAILAAVSYLVACGDDPESNNLAPTVELTAGPMDGDSTSWNASFQWLGADLDGNIEGYEYALDVPPELMDRIDEPTTPGITWIATTNVEGRFDFTTPDPDSAYGTGGTPGPPTRFTGHHTFVVRAIDDDGARSPAEYLEFTALNYAPRTTIRGIEGQDVVLWTHNCPALVRWDSVDPDAGPTSGLEGVRYEVKFKQMPYTWVPVGRSVEGLLAELADTPWVPVPGDSAAYARPITQTGFPYIMAVRAIDRQGGVESVFIKGRNLLVAELSGFGGTPVLTVRNRLLGVFQFPGPTFEASVAVGTVLRFDLQGDGSNYGGIVDSYNYGIDVDPNGPATGAGWHGWNTVAHTEAISFDDPGVHTIVFRARDRSACSVTSGAIYLRVLAAPLDRDLLYVDDFRRASTDAVQDARNRAMLAAAGIDVENSQSFTQLDAWGVNDGAVMPVVPPLEALLEYRTIYWHTLGSALSRNPALVSATACPGAPVLRAYLAAGGSLWVDGQTVFGALDLAANTICAANLNYEFGAGGDGINYVAGDFPCEFMQMCGGGFMQARGSNVDVNGLLGVDPSAEGDQLGFEGLELDRTVITTPTLGFTDGMFLPTFDGTGGLDTLFVHRAGRTTSGMNRKPNAFRYHDPNPIPSQGPIAVFGFPMYAMEPGSVAAGTGSHGAAKRMLDWLRSEGQRYRDTRP